MISEKIKKLRALADSTNHLGERAAALRAIEKLEALHGANGGEPEKKVIDQFMVRFFGGSKFQSLSPSMKDILAPGQGKRPTLDDLFDGGF